MAVDRSTSRGSARGGLAVAVALLVVAPACGDDDSAGPGGPVAQRGDAAVDAGKDAFFPTAKATDPCVAAGYSFDGSSDCEEVRCPELSCKCKSSGSPDAGEPALVTEAITLHACVPSAGCLSLADCARVCAAEVQQSRRACEARIAAAGAQRCESDDDCVAGECRAERVGSICIDTIGCGEDGHCAAGSACLFDPDTLDTKQRPTTLGTCADGKGGSRCYRDRDCVFGKCDGEQCTAGLDGSACSADGNCASGICRITSPMQNSGACVSGEQGSQCSDDGDCKDGLHCEGGACFSAEIGQRCSRDDQCESGSCVASLCRGGEPGSTCEDDGDCSAGVCVGGACASGALLSPCYEPSDCKSGLACLRQVCSDGSEYLPCATDADCKVLACVSGFCSAGADGARCDADDDCVSQRCADPAGADPGQCTSGAAGSVCFYANNCGSGTCGFNGTCQ